LRKSFSSIPDYNARNYQVEVHRRRCMHIPEKEWREKKPEGSARSRTNASLDPIHRRPDFETYWRDDVIHIRCQKPRGASPLSEISDGPNPDSPAISPVRDTSGSDLSVELKMVRIAKNWSVRLEKLFFVFFEFVKKKICYWNWVKKSHRYLSQNPRIFYSKNVASKRYILKATTVNH